MTTIVDLAQHCGVSTATISMVLRNKGRISEKTRDRVLKAVDELGYIYNQSAANLRSRNNNQIALLVNDINNPFFSQLTTGVNEHVESINKLLFLAISGNSKEKQEKFIDNMLSYNTSGLILCPTPNFDVRLLDTLKKRQLSIVLTVRPIDGTNLDFVGTDNFYGAQLVTKHLIDQGHRNIAFVGGEEGSVTRSSRLAGYMSKLMEHGITPNPDYILQAQSTRRGGADAMRYILQYRHKVTAVVCHQDVIAFGVMNALHSKGVFPGKDFAVTGFDDVPEASETFPSLTTVSVSAKEIGRRATMALVDRLEGNDEPARRIIISPELIVRQSSLS
ncbi:LacI family DNA-binding transcriptional regulator [Vibrio owensii]|uniref:LacI family DNA-binding transcriptional regulator n=1 Tax=Vibrio owensii TaxID=696485 RepID=UPI004067AC1E